MKKKILVPCGAMVLFLVSALAISSCQEEKKTDRRIIEVNGVSNAAEIIRNPISATGVNDTINIAKMYFEETRFNFGTVNEGDKVKHSFSFTNTGKIPLIINDARSTCGCTVPKYPKDAIAPGQKGKIDVVFDTSNKTEKQDKAITITANTYPSKSVLHLEGFVSQKK